MQEIDRVKEKLADILEDWMIRRATPSVVDQILSLKIDGTTLKELLEKLDETGGKLAIVEKQSKEAKDAGIPASLCEKVIWQGGQE